ncbi:hypothetical protein [Arthrobacter sp. A5]|uniref:hypothetical protein n=1 Tax=Arthrobacter sp. A5 TaxID=576926 RepID=UPI003DA85A8B
MEAAVGVKASVIAFDVNETLSDMSPIGVCFGEVGAPEYLAKAWFASLLRDGFALAAAGGRQHSPRSPPKHYAGSFTLSH